MKDTVMKSLMISSMLIFSYSTFGADIKYKEDSDISLTGPAKVYEHSNVELLSNTSAGGNSAVADVMTNGTSLQYAALLLNVGAGLKNIFIKVQQQEGSGNFSHAACYTGNNGPSFGLGFFRLAHPFSKGNLKAIRIGSTVNIFVQNAVDASGTPVSDQSYICNNAPDPEGNKIGIAGYQGYASIDNFGNGQTILDTFFYSGPLGKNGSWSDINPGMSSNWNHSKGGSQARSVWN